MPTTRQITPEILDHLPWDDPRAQKSRRDLILINRLMGNYRWIEQTLARHLQPNDQCLEIGSGDGTLGARLAQSHSLPPDFSLNGLDLHLRPEGWPTTWDWQQRDLFQFENLNQYNLLIFNLLLHHFTEKKLKKIGDQLSSARLLIGCEPARGHLPHLWGFLLRAAGINSVTRHDLHASIRAGFQGNELAEALALHPADWQIHTETTALGAYRFLAIRT